MIVQNNVRHKKKKLKKMEASSSSVYKIPKHSQNLGFLERAGLSDVCLFIFFLCVYLWSTHQTCHFPYNVPKYIFFKTQKQN